MADFYLLFIYKLLGGILMEISFVGLSGHMLEDQVICWRVRSYVGGSDHMLGGQGYNLGQNI